MIKGIISSTVIGIVIGRCIASIIMEILNHAGQLPMCKVNGQGIPYKYDFLFNCCLSDNISQDPFVLHYGHMVLAKTLFPWGQW